MSRTCTICTSQQRAAIERAIVEGCSLCDIAARFSVGRMAVQRHASEHIAQAIQAAQEAHEEERGLDVMRQLRAINATTLKILKEARDSGQNLLALQAIDRVTKQLELQAKLMGQIEAPQVNVYASAEWHAICDVIMRALAPYMEARISVAAALAEMEPFAP